MQTLNKIVKSLNDISTNHLQINSFVYGEVEDIATSGTTIYPLMFVDPLPASSVGKVLRMGFSVAVMDLVHKGNTNIQEVESDVLLIMTDIIALLQDAEYEFNLDASNIRITQFRERFADEVTGWQMELTFNIPFGTDRCAVPTT